jgi:hypothetical protein
MIFSNLVSFLFICSSLSLVDAETCNQYELVTADGYTPGVPSDTSLGQTKESCYQLCADSVDCEYFTFGEEGGAHAGTCITSAGVSTGLSLNAGFNIYAICKDSGVYGDPHMLTWSGKNYDFHGICDLVLVSNPALDIQIRTHKINEWSYVEAASLRIGDDVLEVTGGKDSMNKVRFNGAIHEFEKRNKTVLDISGYPVVFTKTSDKSQKIEVHLGDNEKISFSTWNSFVSVKVQNPSEEVFGSSVGLMGSFPSGKMVARDNKTILNDVNEFGNEWQVKGDEATLFHKARVPQFPQECEIPSSLEMRRRLEASDISVQGAEIACASVEKYLKDLCMFDVMASSDVSIAGAY